MMRRAAKTDANQRQIVTALREIGASVQSLAGVANGCPDIAVGFRGRTFLLELKDGGKCASARRLTPAQTQWHLSWRGGVSVVTDVDSALRAIGVTVR